MQFPSTEGLLPLPNSSFYTIPSTHTNPTPSQLANIFLPVPRSSNKTFRARRAHESYPLTKAPSDDEVNIFFKKFNHILENIEEYDPKILGPVYKKFSQILLYFRNSNSLVFDKKFDEFLSFTALKKFPAALKKTLELIPPYEPLFVFTHAVPSDVLKEFVDHHFSVNISGVNTAEYADYSITCNNKVFHLYSIILQRDFKAADIPAKLDEINKRDPLILELLLEHSCCCESANLQQLQPEQLKSYIRASILLDFQKELSHLERYCSDSKYHPELLQIFIDLYHDDVCQNSEIVSNAIEDLISKCLAKLLKNPIKYTQSHIPVLEKYGSYLKHLRVDLKCSIYKFLPSLFPNLESLMLTTCFDDKWKKLLKDGQLSNLREIHVDFEFSSFHLSLFENMPQLEKIEIVVRRGSSIRPFLKPELMGNLKTLGFLYYTDEDGECSKSILPPLTLKSIARLPTLENLGLESIEFIDFFALREILQSKTLKTINIQSCRYCFQFPPSPKPLAFDFKYDLFGLQSRFKRIKIIREGKGKAFLQTLNTPLSQSIELSNQNPTLITTEQEAIRLLEKVSFKRFLNVQEALINRSLNRYPDIMPYDYNSISQEIGFYLNGSRIDGIDKRIRYATQGPLITTQGDFWSAALKVKTSLIVMATDFSEGSTVKCVRYWPTQKEQKGLFEDQLSQSIDVELLSEILMPGLELREFSVKCEQTSQEQRIKHLHIKDWQDHRGRTSTQLHNLINHIIELENLSPENSTLIHCSAGIGRTGLVLLCLAIEKSIQDLAENFLINPREFRFNAEKALRALRIQRAEMITTPEQLISAIDYFNYRIDQICAAQQND